MSSAYETAPGGPAPGDTAADGTTADETAAKALALLAIPGVGPVTVWHAREDMGSLRAVYDAWRRGDAFGRSNGPGAGDRPKVPAGAPEILGRVISGCLERVAAARDAGLQVLTLEDPGYPQMLMQGGHAPPPLLFVRGPLPAQLVTTETSEQASAGVVGTRDATKAGLDEARSLGRALSACGAVVVSGLALGIDGAAHAGAVAARRALGTSAAPTVAVLGGAHDRLHPKLHAHLAEQVLEHGGAVISEHPPGSSPRRGTFLQRNRVIAGLSHVLVVVEAGRRSGANNTATAALDLSRQVLTVPARPSDRRRAGNLALLRDGATPLIDLTDLAAAFSGIERVSSALRDYGAGPREQSARRSEAGRTGSDGGLPGGAIDEQGPSTPSTSPLARLSVSERRALVHIHQAGELSFDGLLARLTGSGAGSGPTPSELAGLLVRLEVAGAVLRGDDGRYRAGAPSFGSDGPSGPGRT